MLLLLIIVLISSWKSLLLKVFSLKVECFCEKELTEKEKVIKWKKNGFIKRCKKILGDREIRDVRQVTACNHVLSNNKLRSHDSHEIVRVDCHACFVYSR